MASAFSRGLYGAGPYSRDALRFAVSSAMSSVGVRARVRHVALVQINAQSSVEVTGRLLWDRIAVEPCEGKWTPLVNSPCRRVA